MRAAPLLLFVAPFALSSCVLREDAAQDLVSSPCPDVLWQEALAAALPPTTASDPPLTFLNVGANKGYNIANFLSLWHSSRGVSNRAWHAAILRFARAVGSKSLQHVPHVSCGVCMVCKKPSPTARPKSAPRVAIHALELLPHNAQLLESVINRTGVRDLVNVHAVAASNASGTLKFVRSKMANYGREQTMLCAGHAHAALASSARSSGGGGGVAASATTPGRDATGDDAGVGALPCTYRGKTVVKPEALAEVKVTTVDAFLSSQPGLLEQPTFLVSVDTEGYDALVIEGMRTSLRQKRVRLLEFEYGAKGFWAPATPPPAAGKRTLQRLLSEILIPSGYVCYWQTKRHLVRVDEPCWAGALTGSHASHSNVLCAHEPAVLAILDTLRPQSARTLVDGLCGAYGRQRANEVWKGTNRTIGDICESHYGGAASACACQKAAP